MYWLPSLLADGGGTPEGGPPGLVQLFPFIAMFVIFMIFQSRKGARERKEAQTLLANLKKNDKVYTSAGIVGVVVGIKENDDEVVLRVDDTTNSRMRILKSFITRVITEEQQQQQAAQPTEAKTT